MKVEFISDNGDGVKWYQVAGQTFGMEENGRLLDESGNPFDLTHHTHDTRLFLGEVTSAINDFTKTDVKGTRYFKKCSGNTFNGSDFFRKDCTGPLNPQFESKPKIF